AVQAVAVVACVAGARIDASDRVQVDRERAVVAASAAALELRQIGLATGLRVAVAIAEVRGAGEDARHVGADRGGDVRVVQAVPPANAAVLHVRREEGLAARGRIAVAVTVEVVAGEDAGAGLALGRLGVGTAEANVTAGPA